MNEINILVSVNRAYLKYLKVLIYSIVDNNPNTLINIYIANQDLAPNDFKELEIEPFKTYLKYIDIKINENEIKGFPVTEKRYPVEIYFRFIALKHLPNNINRILYLDTDTIVINSLSELYNMDFESNLFIACTHIKKMAHRFNEIRLNMNRENAYINSGVLLMNLEELRKIDISSEILTYATKNRKRLMLPDQDIISTLYGDRIKLVNSLKYNLGDRTLKDYNLNNLNSPKDIEWVKNNTVIIHYFGRNKPWKTNYTGKLDNFYQKYYQKIDKI